jgi:tritrans,polycis-undecaprenyl-diphosphate synthase [geranylgeranyl-diphosphate specific]
MLPKHVGMILDGNRRYAKELMKKPWEGHKYGIKKVREVLDWVVESKIKYTTAYTLSLENLKTRPKRELDYILKILKDEMKLILKDKTHVVNKKKINMRFIGRRHVLSKDLQELMAKVEEKTKNNKKHFTNLAIAYGGQQEIVDATKKIVEQCMKGVINPAELDEKIIKQNLYTNGNPYPDMIIRSGGEKRLSNFLPFQSAYSELFFTDKKWPELTKEEGFLEEFKTRQRRFGR